MKRFLLATFLIGLLLMGCKTSDPASEVPVFNSPEEFNTGLAKAIAIAKGPLDSFAQGDELGETNKRDLIEAERITEGLIVYDPKSFGPFVLAGKIAAALGDTRTARDRLAQATRLAPKSAKEEVLATVAETYYELSKLDLADADVAQANDHASIALGMAPKNPDYLAMKAAILVQMEEVVQAKRLLQEALTIAPDHARSRQLITLIEKAAAEKKTEGTKK